MSWRRHSAFQRPGAVRRRRLTLTAVLGAAGALLAAAAAVTWWVPREVERQLGARLGARVHVAGVRVRPTRIECAEIEIFGQPPFAREVAARLQHVSVALAWTAGRPGVASVRIENATVEYLQAGTLRNWPGLGRSSGSSAVGRPRAVPVLVTAGRLRAVVQPADGPLAGHRATLRVSRFQVTGHWPGALQIAGERAALDVLGVATARAHRFTLSPDARGWALLGADVQVALPGADALLAWQAVTGRLDRNAQPQGARLAVQAHGAFGDLAVRAAGEDVDAELTTRVPLAALRPWFDPRGVGDDPAARSSGAELRFALHRLGTEPVQVRADVTATGLRVGHPALDREPWPDVEGRLELQASFTTQAPRRLQVQRAAIAAFGAEVVARGAFAVEDGGVRGSIDLATPPGGLACETLVAQQAAPVRAALAGLALRGRLSGEAHVRFDSAAWESLDLDGQLARSCEVVGEPAAVLALRSPAASPLVGGTHLTPLGRIPRAVVDAFIAAEDDEFFQHHGFRFAAIRRALIHDLEVGWFARGASTITQQLTRTLLLGTERTVARKLEEAVLAWRLDAQLSKRRILELYLSSIELGPSIRGVSAAARAYFGVPLERLGPLQAAHLASLAPNPVGYARRFRDGKVDAGWLHRLYDLLAVMKRSGRLTPAQVSAARTERLTLRPI